MCVRACVSVQYIILSRLVLWYAASLSPDYVFFNPFRRHTMHRYMENVFALKNCDHDAQEAVLRGMLGAPKKSGLLLPLRDDDDDDDNDDDDVCVCVCVLWRDELEY